MSKTNAEMLSAVQDAIYRIVSYGQSVQFEDRRVSEADLDQLYKIEAYYQKKVNKDARGGMRIRGGTPV